MTVARVKRITGKIQVKYSVLNTEYHVSDTPFIRMEKNEFSKPMAAYEHLKPEQSALKAVPC